MSLPAATTPDPTGISVYIHVPFCATKCAYCDFHSVPVGREHTAAIANAMDAYLWSIRTVGAMAPLLRDVPTLYVGGGTPTVLGTRLPQLIATVRAMGAELRPGAEVTVEANPDSLDARLVGALVDVGVTRVSLGVQSFDDAVLRALGRCHDTAAARKAAQLVVGAGLDLSVDLMCGIPGQSMDSWKRSLEEAVASGAGHLSVYPLAVEDGTPLGAAVDAGTFPDNDSDVAAAMMLKAADTLMLAGFERYEVANYARPGKESRHNLRYWTGGEYLGVGPAAASMLSAAEWAVWERAMGGQEHPDTTGFERVRFTTRPDLDGPKGFLTSGMTVRPETVERLERASALREDAMLGMRLTRAISDELAAQAGVVSVLEGLVAERLVVHTEGRWRTNTRGWLLGNEVFGRIWTDE